MKKFLLLFIPIFTFSFLFTTNKTYAQEYSQGETWVINEILNYQSFQATNISFTSNGLPYTSITRAYFPDGNPPYQILKYGFTNVYYDDTGWSNEAYRIITFETAPTGELLEWLQANAVKLGSGYDEGYQEGYDEGYQDGFIAGEKSKIAKNNESFYNNIAIWIPAVITVVALASIISYLGLKRKDE